MKRTLILNANIVNEGRIVEGDLLIAGDRIEKISGDLSSVPADETVDANGRFLLPGLIDDQVHFREPGLTHKADIFTESRAAVAGGVTSFMEMPNTVPNTLTQTLLENKYAIAGKSSLANYSFYMGVSNDNLDEVLRTNPSDVCGVKVFMGSSTGNMLVDDFKTLEGLFSRSEMLIAAHCEDETTIRINAETYRNRYGENVPVSCHPLIRTEEACYKSSSMAVALAKKNGARLHVLHISTGRELALFDNSIPLEEKKITAEACIHHLWFTDADYEQKGALIKWNPAIKTASDRDLIFAAILNDTIDVVATDHAPHTLEEKNGTYFNAPSGGPLIQHSLAAMLAFYHKGMISLEKIVKKMCHDPAILFRITDRGFIREGYFADLALVDLNAPWTVEKSNILAKCGWSPFEGQQFKSRITDTWVSGFRAYKDGRINEGQPGRRLKFSAE